jgi:hypothetical protein
MSWFGTRGIVLTKGDGFRNNSGSFATFAAIRRASSRVSSLAINSGLTRLWVALIGCGRLWR